MTKRYLLTPEEVIKALRDGKELTDNLNNKYKLIDGFVRSINPNGGWGINPYVGGDIDGLYVDEPEPLKLEVGKFYKTRDGEKALVYGIISDAYPYSFYVAKIGKLDTYNVNSAGLKTTEETPLDLVAPWED